MVFTNECSNHSNITKILLYSGYSSIGRTTVCGTVRSLFKSGSPHLKVFKISPVIIWIYQELFNKARIVQQVRTLISYIKNENSSFSPGSGSEQAQGLM